CRRSFPMHRLLSRLFGQKTNTKRRRLPPTRVLQLEDLETRLVPAVSLVNGDIYITGTTANDTVSVRLQSGFYKGTETGRSRFFQASDVFGGDINFTGNAGNDRFENLTSLRANAKGGPAWTPWSARRAMTASKAVSARTTSSAAAATTSSTATPPTPS